MKSILITGAGGFIGSHLTEACLQQGYKVRALVRYNSRNHWGWLEPLRPMKSLQIITGDIRDYDGVASAMDGCDAVFHLAALIGIPYSYISPLAYIKTNVEGTYNILQAAKESGVKKVLVTSTSETYGTAQYVPIDEKHPAVGQSPYAASKVAADQLALSYWRSFGLPVTVVRPFNTYGPRQSARAIIPTVITQILAGKHQIKLGNTSPTRDLTFVKDTVQAFLAIGQARNMVGKSINVGTNTEISVTDLSHTIAGLMKSKITIVQESKRVRNKNSEVERLRCDNSLMLKLTSWRPKTDLNKGLKETIAWIKKHQNMYKAELYNV